jgi:SnoaL-like domain
MANPILNEDVAPFAREQLFVRCAAAEAKSIVENVEPFDVTSHMLFVTMRGETVSMLDTEKRVEWVAIEETIIRMGWLIDRRDWDELLGLFTNRVEVDYTSLFGGEPETITAEDLVSRWRGILDALAATQHLIASVLVDLHGDEAQASANVVGTHVLPNASGGPTWTVGGTYQFTLVRHEGCWCISTIALEVAWVDGNQHILTLAADSVGPTQVTSD